MVDIDKLEASVPRSDDEYVGENGMLHCKKCGEPLEDIFDVPGRGKRKCRFICSCTKAKLEASKAQDKEDDKQRKRMVCFHGSKMSECRFETSESSELVKMGMNFAKHFQGFKKDGKGLLLYGTVGTGKSHVAACIANSLIDNGYSAYMTNFATIANELQGTFEKQEYIDSLNKYDLLILDDLGIERKTEFMQEQVFNVIDSRYRSGLPFIITTNLTPEELKKTTDIGNGRIYDRILERCHPVKATGESYRRQKLKDDYKQIELILKG